MIKKVVLPDYLKDGGIEHCKKGYKGPWRLASADTETVHGKPYTLQLCFDGKAPIVKYVHRGNILPIFTSELCKWAQKGATNAIFFHRLSFDMQAILYNHQQLFSSLKRDFHIRVRCLSCGHWHFYHCFTDKTWFARITFSKNRMVHVLDSLAFFHTSLEKAAKLVKSPFAKLKRPKGLGERRLKDRYFQKYIRADVLAQWHLGAAIEKIHKDQDVQLSVSLPHLASRVFKHRFLRPGDRMEVPPDHVRLAAELSYHGGKNQMSVKPGWYKNVSELDLNSAYTWAMSQLPSFLEGEYVRVQGIPKKGCHGIVCVSGTVQCKYGIVFTHNFKRINGKFRNIWITTYELESALKHGDLEVDKCKGYIWISKSDYNPIKAFAQHFWEDRKAKIKIYGKKCLETDTPKLICNSLYGKWLQQIRQFEGVTVNEEREIGVNEYYLAGSSYHPFVGTLITGAVRALIHKFEHKYDSIHTSTDAVKTLMKPDPRDINKELGGLNLEVYGDCLLIRPKLYIHYKKGFNPRSKEGKPKAALHGFRAKWQDLLDASELILKGKRFEYFIRHCFTVRQVLGRRRGKRMAALDFVKIPAVLNPPEYLDRAPS